MMNRWLDHIRLLWRSLWRRAEPVPEPPAAVTAAEVSLAPPLPVPARAKAIDEKIRALELARLRRDKFVTPKGERPKREPRPKKIRQPVLLDEKPIPVGECKDASLLIADELVEGDGRGDVLFHESEFWGEFSFRDSILDQLDRYWIYLKRMRKHDPGAYEMCRQLGATLVPYSSTWSNCLPKRDRNNEEIEQFKSGVKLPAWFKQHWPAFGCIAIGTNPLDEAKELKSWEDSKDGMALWCVKFLYFRKINKTPWFVQPVRSGHLYEMSIWWDRPHDPKHSRRKWGVPQKFYVWIADDGNTMRVLKTRKRGSKFLAAWDWCIDYQVSVDDRNRGYTPQLVLARKFCDAAKLMEHAAYAMCRVEVSKGEMAATFGVSPKRMAYFFRDRDVNLTADGQTKRIFHIVRPHVRSNGIVVPMHFRGLKQFTWADYSVSITVPGRDHFMLPEFDVGGQYPPEHGRWSKKLVTEEEIAAQLKNWIEQGTGRLH